MAEVQTETGTTVDDRARKEADLRALEWNLTNHPPNRDAIRRMEALRETAKLLAQDIIDMTPVGREQSLAKTHLEQTVMWAVAAVARDPASVVDGAGS